MACDDAASRSATPLAALPWMGGKSPRRALGRWVAGHVAPGGVPYVEPFAGMLGVLLQRPRAGVEIVNDRDLRIVNFWRAVRDEGERFGRLLEGTHQHARAEYEWAAGAVDDPNVEDVMRAVAFTVLIQGAMKAAPVAPGLRPGGFLSSLSPTGGQRKALCAERVLRLRDRLREVVIENVCAIDLLRRSAGFASATIYVDPPYDGAAGYGVGVDRAVLACALRAQRGAVYLSGQDEEWDFLDWPGKVVRRVRNQAAATGGIVNDGESWRRDALWSNRPMAERQIELFPS